MIVCEGDSMLFSCDPNLVISILDANFGRQQPDVCIIDRNINVTCQSPSALEIMQKYCDGKQDCSVMASPNVLGNVCANVTRYLTVFYICIEGMFNILHVIIVLAFVSLILK